MPSTYSIPSETINAFPAVNYSNFMQPVMNKPKRLASIFTMNGPDMSIYRENAYDILMDAGAKNLGIFGPTEILYSFDTYQFHDYARYDAAQFDEAHKAQIRETQFPKDLEKAYELGKRLCSEGQPTSPTCRLLFGPL